jgi:hypothetical protein
VTSAVGSTTRAAYDFQVGDLEASVIDGGLHHLRYRGIELIRSVLVAVRDRRWGTVPGHVDPLVDERRGATRVLQTGAHHDNGEVAFRWMAEIHVAEDGEGACRFDMIGTVERDFWRNRIGICVLHPLHFAGRAVEVVRSDGRFRSRLPVTVAPKPPIPEMVGLRWPDVDGVAIEVSFQGEVFGLEDQRNWTDASFKSFSTPLDRPYPVFVAAGTSIRQSVAIRATPINAPILTPSGRTSRRGRPSAVSELRIGPARLGPVPGLGTAFDGVPLSETGADRLRALSIDHLRVLVDAEEPDWEPRLAAGIDIARRIDARVDLDVVDPTGGDLVGAVIETGRPTLGPDSRTFVYAGPRTSHTTTRALLDRARDALRAGGLGGRLGGGTLRNFYDFAVNPIPYRRLDVATYGINPQMHTFDDESILESVLAQPATVRAARLRCGAVPIALGPVSLRPRRTDASAAPPVAGLPRWVDPRQGSPLAALYALGTLRTASQPGVESLTMFEASGMAGLIADPEGGALDPAFPRSLAASALEALLAARPAAGSIALRTAGPDDVIALVTVEDGKIVALVGNASTKERTIALQARRIVWGDVRPLVGDGSTALPGTGQTAGIGLHLAPWSIMRLEGAFKGPRAIVRRPSLHETNGVP